MILSNQSVLLWLAHSRGKFRYPLWSGVVRCCEPNSILVMGCARGSWQRRSRVVRGGGAWGISLSGRCGAFASCSPALMVAKMSSGMGEVGMWVVLDRSR